MAERSETVAIATVTLVASKGVRTELITVSPLLTLIKVHTCFLVFGVDGHATITVTHATIEGCFAKMFAHE